MKDFKLVFFVSSILIMISNIPLLAQSLYNSGWIQCESIENSIPLVGGFKPERTNVYEGTNPNSVFRVLVVFVQFDNDYTYPEDINWPPQTNTGPIFRDSLFANVRNNSYGNEWWNAYNENTQIISDYFMEMSLGNYHVLGKYVNVILPDDSSHYQFKGGLEELNSDIYSDLETNPNIVWSDFNNWYYDDSNNKIKYGYNDNIIDMIYIVHRVWRDNIKNTGGTISLTPGSIALLYNSQQGVSHTLNNGYSIHAGSSYFGSGITFTTGNQQKEPQLPFSKNRFITTQAHELGHCLGLVHKNYGLMMGENPNLITGPDARFSPWEVLKLGYGNYIDVLFNQINHLNDFSSRDNSLNMQIIKIPISNSYYNPEYYLLALRNKVSKYDRIMIGDTARGDPYRLINDDYGKGLYIYHFNENSNIDGSDLECADGLFNWESDGSFNPDWSNSQTLPFFKPVEVIRDFNDGSYGSMFFADGKSVYGYYNNIRYNNWGGIGQKQSNYGLDGTDKIFTNIREKYTNRSYQGDRWDSWRKEYSNIFSPYSSPSTKNWQSEPVSDKIFIYITGEENNSIDFYVYKPDANLSESQILALTPPSKPMGIRLVEYYTDPDSSICHPKIIWEHNIEPDMPDPNTGKIKYVLYKATQLDMSAVPGNYQPYAHLEFLVSETPYFIDFPVNEHDCSNYDRPPYGEPYPIRYKVKAVDNIGTYSVYSDFVGTEGISDNGGKKANYGDNVLFNKEIKLNISQNYPNPFNPSTRFNYSIPIDGNVKITIFDISGREIQYLINEFKKAGEYILEFNAAYLSSGIYFYRIQSDNKVITKKMIYIK